MSRAITSAAAHWQHIYEAKPDAELSWHQEQAALSGKLVVRYAPSRLARIIDVGAGESALLAGLAELGYERLTALDISQEALDRLSHRLAAHAEQVAYLCANLLEVERLGPFDLWHDRAVFHFFTGAAEQEHYARLAAASVAPGGFMVIGTFAPDGPEQCSGLPVCRYSAAQLAAEFSPAFRLVTSEREVHHTPWGAAQPFTYVVLERRTG